MIAVHRYHHHAIQSNCTTGWAVVHQNRGLAVRLCNGPIDPGQLCNGLIDPGWLYIRQLSGCATGLVNSDRLYIRISPVTYWDS